MKALRGSTLAIRRGRWVSAISGRTVAVKQTPYPLYRVGRVNMDGRVTRYRLTGLRAKFSHQSRTALSST